jgi:hypothetical protein
MRFGSAGDKVEVQIARVDSFKKQVDFSGWPPTALPERHGEPKIPVNGFIASASGIFQTQPPATSRWLTTSGNEILSAEGCA